MKRGQKAKTPYRRPEPIISLEEKNAMYDRLSQKGIMAVALKANRSMGGVRSWATKAKGATKDDARMIEAIKEVLDSVEGARAVSA